MINNSHRHSAPRLMPLCFALALAAALPLLTPSTARADNPAAVTGLTLRSQMNPPNGGDMSALTWSDDAAKPVIDQTPSAENWALDPSADGTFRIRNERDGKCIGFTEGDNHRLASSDCDPGSGQQRWFLEPTGPLTFAIRNASSYDCLDVTGESNGDGSEVGTYSCRNGATNQNWVPGYVNDSMRNLLTLYSLKRCAAGESDLKCTYKEDSTSVATVGPEKCVSALYNNTNGADNEKPSVTFSDTTGWSNSVGGSVTVSAEVGIDEFIVTKVTTAVSVNYSHQWIGQNTVSKTYPFTVRKGEWGWLTRAQLMKQVTGTWTFSKGDETWSGTGTSTVPAEEGTDGAQSVVTPHSSPNPPADCPSS
ncbi:RICIN domain-containing protein [Streptomyces tubercidicus]|uniref:RICIN domain-containing protein n=1 Tax=Streptomyces tubercidicus TaxID=47759 RepID=UPI003690EF98